jgi:hypothetical protein
MCKLTFIDLQDESTLPPLDMPVWLIEADEVIFIGCRTIVEEDDVDGYLWLWALCTSYYHSSKEQQWKCDDADCDDYNPTAWMYLPNLQDLLTQTY